MPRFVSRPVRILVSLAILGVVLTPLLLFGLPRSLSIAQAVLPPTLSTPIVSWGRRAYDASRNIWQSYCTKYHPILLYVPINGTCNFINFEFDTEITFDQYARADAISVDTKNILVIGDSFAMGWGVDDSETFAYHIEQTLGINVVNAAVSSFGTAREFQYAQLFHKRNYDLIILQYCDNDYGENSNYVANNISYPRPVNSFEKLQRRQPRMPPSRLVFGSRAYIELVSRIRRQIFQTTQPPKQYSTSRETLPDPTDHFQKGDWRFHRGAVESIIKKFRPTLGNPPVLITYLNSHNRRLSNFPTTSVDNHVHFVTPELTDSDFFLLDGHLNTSGHKKLATQIVEYLRAHLASVVMR